MCAGDPVKSFTTLGRWGERGYEGAETWYQGIFLKLKDDFQGNADLVTLSRGLPREIRIVHFLYEDPRGRHMPSSLEFEVRVGRGGFYEGERFRLTSGFAGKVYQRFVPG